MDKNKIKDFFNNLASDWDKSMIKDDRIMNIILDNCEVKKGNTVLDVACGTGVMIDYYLEREVDRVIGVDISEKMCKIAQDKYINNDNVSIICKDIEEYDSDILFDNIVVYNSFPHFIDSERLISHLVKLLKKDGVLTIAHGMSRDKINSHHINVSDDIKCELMEADKLSELLSKYLNVTTVISNDDMYQVAGKNCLKNHEY